MDYHHAVNFLLALQRFRPKPGTEATADLLAHLGDPHGDVRFVQVAGSNGKGSTARMVEATLRTAGLSTGLYTSPHVDDLRERARVDGRKIPKAAVTEFVEAARPFVNRRAANGRAPTFFETLTAMALWHFGREDVDAAVLEVGIGGRYDATSVVDPVAAAVTAVTLEHTGIIGETVEEIARDKAHVAPADAPLVTATTGAALDAVREVAGDVRTVGDEGCDVTATYRGRDGIEGQVTLAGADWRVETKLSLLGSHQARNAGVAAALARQFADASDGAVSLPEETVARGLRSAEWPGRFEVFEQNPLVVLDGAHNPGACEALAATLAEFDYDDLHLVFGAMHEKDHREMAAALPDPETVVATQPDALRAADADVLASVFEDGEADRVDVVRAVPSAVERALDRADPDDCVLVTGSLYAVGEARTRWSRTEVPKRVRDLAESRATLESADVTAPGVWRMRAKGVHRTLKTRVRPRQAQYLKEEMLSLGGECATSGVDDQREENLDVVLMGTLAQFKRLVEKLEGQPLGLSVLADQLRTALDIQTGPASTGYPWDDGPAIMGVLNVTPDSFHDGGRYDRTDDAVAHAREMVAAGADIVDVGGESTRPGADPVDPDTERERVVPVVERLSDLDAIVSVDTRRASVAEAALQAGAGLVNDVSGLSDPEMRFVAADHDVPLVVMHSIDAPVVPGRDVHYDDVVEDVVDQLTERVLLAEKAGLDRDQILVDPGLGFGKASAESFALLDRLGELRALGCPVMVGHSHKSMFDGIGYGPGERLAPTVAATALAVERGADVVRVHDVAENLAAVRTVAAARRGTRGDGDE